MRRARARDRGWKGEGKRFLMELGIPENEIIEECRSKDTSENARYAKQIIDPQISQIDADLRISHRCTQTDTDFCPSDMLEQK